MINGNAARIEAVEEKLADYQAEVIAVSAKLGTIERKLDVVVNQTATLTQRVEKVVATAVAEAIEATRDAIHENARDSQIVELEAQVAERDEKIAEEKEKRGKWANLGWDVAKVLVGIVAAEMVRRMFHF